MMKQQRLRPRQGTEQGRCSQRLNACLPSSSSWALSLRPELGVSRNDARRAARRQRNAGRAAAASWAAPVERGMFERWIRYRCGETRRWSQSAGTRASTLTGRTGPSATPMTVDPTPTDGLNLRSAWSLSPQHAVMASGSPAVNDVERCRPGGRARERTACRPGTTDPLTSARMSRVL